MYGLIGKIQATAGDGKRLAQLLATMGDMPGCLSYVAATDAAEPDIVWVTEVWESREAHKTSLSLAAVQAAIEEGRPMIAGFVLRHETVPLGGNGIAIGSGA